MKIEKLKKEQERLGLYLEVASNTKRALFDIQRKIEIEEEKDSIESFLMIGKQWYLDRELHNMQYLEWLENRIRIVIKNMQNYAS